MKPWLMTILASMLAGAAQPAAGVNDLDWMTGCWESVDGERWTEECWSAPRGGTMIGFSRSGRGEAMRAFEYLRIAPAEDGVPTYLASPGGRPAVAFRLDRSGAAEAVFVNPEHDFPQRIHYRREADAIEATISAEDGSRPMRWTYRRVPGIP